MALITAVLLSCGRRDAATADRALVRAAVAANFAAAQQELSQRYEQATGVAVETSLGATGVLYAQIVSGAPFDVFLAADTLRPALLEAEGFAVPGSRFSYAVGRLALFAPRWDSVGPGATRLSTRSFRHLAIANPRTAPYGVAAQTVLMGWGLWDSLGNRIVRGENVGQVFQFVESGAAEVGLVALSQVIARDARRYWVVPQDLHPPLHQDAVLLEHGRENAAARAFLVFLQSEEARQVMESLGYGHP